MSSLYHPYKGKGGPQHHGQSLIGNKNQSSKNKKNDAQAHNAGGHSEYNLVAPIRQTASIFKQPVTVYKEHKSKVKAELKHVSREKPLQLFWTKRLSSINTVNMTEPDMGRRRITLPPSLKSTGPGITDHQLLASISTHLHISKDPASGQASTTSNIEKNPTAFINPGQPLMCKVSVSDEEILEQEARVKEARQKLARAIKALG